MPDVVNFHLAVRDSHISHANLLKDDNLALNHDKNINKIPCKSPMINTT